MEQMLAAVASAVATLWLTSAYELIGATVAFIVFLVAAAYYTSPFTVGAFAGATAALIFYFLNRV